MSCPHTPQQNGIAERKHRHLVETALTLMIEAQIPTSFWYHSCSYAAFLIKRMPSRTLEMKSPYQVLFGQNPEVHTLKIFGTAVYPLLKPFNANKLQPRVVQCVFMGFAMGYKGVICYEIKSRKFIMSRHVTHDEDVYPFQLLCQSGSRSISKSTPETQSSVIIHLPDTLRSSTGTAQNLQEVYTMVNSDSTNTLVHNDHIYVLNDTKGTSDSQQGNSSVLAESSGLQQHHHSPHHHSGTSSMLPVHSSTQLEVILPVSPQYDSSAHDDLNTHSMTTRLKSGTIPRKNYAALMPSCPELHSL